MENLNFFERPYIRAKLHALLSEITRKLVTTSAVCAMNSYAVISGQKAQKHSSSLMGEVNFNHI
jgi:hypothetical protein